MANLRPMSARVRQTDASHRVTTLELFFDLVFVFAFTQVTQLMAADPTWTGAARGLLLLALLWWAWCSYAWLGNQAHADHGLLRSTVVVAMAAMFIVALTLPESFADLPGGVFSPFVLAACYAVVRLAHLACYVVAAGSDAGLRRQVLLVGIPVSGAVTLLVIGGALGPPYQTPLWVLALLVDYSGIWLAGSTGWRVSSPVHFADRHGLIFIVALGESLVALGVGVAGKPVSMAVIGASILGVVIAVCLYWLYFGSAADTAEEALSRSQGDARSRLARDAYTYLHFVLVVPIIFIALGLKKILEYVADSEHHSLSDALTGVPLVALYGGVAVHLLGHVAFRRRTGGAWYPHGLAVAVALVALVAVAWRLPALASLGLIAGILAALAGYDVVRPPKPRVRG